MKRLAWMWREVLRKLLSQQWMESLGNHLESDGQTRESYVALKMTLAGIGGKD